MALSTTRERSPGGVGGASGRDGGGTIVGAPGLAGDGVSVASGGRITNGSTSVGSALISGLNGIVDSGYNALTVTNFGNHRGDE